MVLVLGIGKFILVTTLTIAANIARAFLPLSMNSNRKPSHYRYTSVSLSATNMSSTFYRRQLPNSVVSFSSKEGRNIFASSMATGGTATFFALIEQLQTQPEPAYCGLTTLVIVLNALAVDPRRLWKGPWRWYEESMLNCCVDLEQVKEKGISFDTFACLAKCQGLGVQATRASDTSLEEFRKVIEQICTNTSDSGCGHPTSFLVVSYTRKVLGQTGTGHFSPIGAYDEVSDSVLLLDTARFKYGPHWVKVELLFQALIPLDPSTGKSRGYMTLSYKCAERGGVCCGDTYLSHLPLSIMFRPQNSSESVQKYKEFINRKRNVSEDGEIDLPSVVAYWTQDYTNSTFVLEVIQPQLRPVNSDEIKMVEAMHSLINTMVGSVDERFLHMNLASNGRQDCNSTTNKECCTSSTQSFSQRFIQIKPIDSIFIVYLASLTKEARETFFHGMMQKNVYDSAAMEQLMTEVSLLSYAIETSGLTL